jgi:hypothetical protein
MFILSIFLYSIVKSGNCLWFRRLETELLNLFAIFAFSIYGIVVWLEELSSCFTALLADNVLQICFIINEISN